MIRREKNTLGDFLLPVKSVNPESTYGDADFMYLDIASVNREEKLIESPQTISGSCAPSRARQLVALNDVIVSTVRPNLNTVAVISQSEASGIASTGFCVLRANPEYLFHRYLFHWIASTATVEYLVSVATGASYPAVSDRIIKGMPFSPPSLTEQKRIAAILDKADSIRRKRQQAIKLADEFLRTVFLEMFGDPVTNPKKWEVKTVSDCLIEKTIIDIQDGNHGNVHPKVMDFTDEGFPFITANVVRKGKIIFNKCYYLDERWLKKLRIGFAKPGDVLISHKGSLGFTAVLDETYSTYIFSPQTTYYRLNSDYIDPEYLKGYFDSNSFQALFQKEGIQSTRAYLGITRQKTLPILLPPIEIQRNFNILVKIFNKRITQLENSEKIASSLFNSLSQKAFSGEL